MTTLDEFTNYLKPKFQHFVIMKKISTSKRV
jgi:hypothetical protein